MRLDFSIPQNNKRNAVMIIFIVFTFVFIGMRVPIIYKQNIKDNWVTTPPFVANTYFEKENHRWSKGEVFFKEDTTRFAVLNADYSSFTGISGVGYEYDSALRATKSFTTDSVYGKDKSHVYCISRNYFSPEATDLQTIASNPQKFSFLGLYRSDNTTNRKEYNFGKTDTKVFRNCEEIKDIKDPSTFTLIFASEGLAKDSKSVYRCDEYGCKELSVEDPTTFERVSNIYAMDKSHVYVLSPKTRDYEILNGADRPTFRSYFEPNEDYYGLYGWDNYHLYKYDQIIEIKPNYNAFRSFMFSNSPKYLYFWNEGSLNRSLKTDAFMQYVSDGTSIYHAQVLASSTGEKVNLTKLENADLGTFAPLITPIYEAGYYKYAYDKNKVYCDSMEYPTGRKNDYSMIFVSKGITQFDSKNSQSLQLVYPYAISKQDHSIQIAKTKTEVFINCNKAFVSDPESFQIASPSKYEDPQDIEFKDRFHVYKVTIDKNNPEDSTLKIIK